MPLGTVDDPIEISTSVARSMGRHFWQVVAHPSATPILYPNLQSFLEEVTPVILDKVDPGQCFEFSTDPNGAVFQLTYDAQTEDYYIRRVFPYLANAALTRLPKRRPTVLQ